MEARKQRAAERVLSDPALTNALTDEQARRLLSWAEEQIDCLVEATRNLDDAAAWEALGPRLQDLRQQVRRMAELGAQTEEPGATIEALTAVSGDREEEDEDVQREL